MPPKQKGTKRAAAAAAVATDSDSDAPTPTPSKRLKGGAKSAAATLVSLPDAPTCPVCLEAYECEEAQRFSQNHIPRTLPCTHSLCSACLYALLARTPGRVTCPTCRSDRPVQMPAGMAAAAVSTTAAWMRLVPQSSDIIQSVRRSQRLELALKLPTKKLQVAPATRCSAHPSCAAAAVKWCEECDSEMCAKHDASTHARSLSDHTRTPLSHKQAQQQAKLQTARAAAGAELKSDVDDAVDRLTQVVNGDDARVEQMELELAEMRTELAELRTKRTADKKLLSELRSGQKRLSGISDADAQSHEATLDGLLEAASPPDEVSVDLIEELTYQQLGELVYLFIEAEVPFGLPKLVYRGSCDGFAASDFARECGGLSRTLTIIKVADNGFVFGAYTHCQWPAAKGIVADPTGKSFLFSLINGSGKAVRFSLRDKNRAIRLNDCVCFGASKYEGGKLTGFPNLMLMHQGAADQKDANCANPLNAKDAYQPDDDEVCDDTILAGQQVFAAEQIEVYQL